MQAANRGRRAADYLEERGVDGLVGDLQGFARRRPGAFLGGAVLAGLVAGRLMKAGKAAHSDDGVARQVPETAEPVPPVGEPVRTELQEYPGWCEMATISPSAERRASPLLRGGTLPGTLGR